MGNSESVKDANASKKLCQNVKNGVLICDEKFEKYGFSLYNLSKTKLYDYSTISIFCYNFENGCESLLAKLNNRISSKLLNIRHPHVLKCFDSIDDDSNIVSNNTYQHYFVTEPVVPLSKILSTLTEYEIILGFYQILQALEFLHDRANIAHCALSFRGSIFVSLSSGSDWRLGAGEFMCALNELDHERIRLFQNLKGTVNEENQQTKTVSWNVERADSYDIFCLGQLILEILEITGCFDVDLMAFAHTAASSCCHSDPMQRPTVRELLSHNVFGNAPLVCLTKGLRNVTVLSPEEQISFFQQISNKLFALPEEVVACRLGNLLLSRAVLVQPLAKKYLLPYLLHPYKEDINDRRPSDNSQLMSESLFAKHLAPLLSCILEVRERHVRLALLDHFHHFVHLLQMNDLRRLLPHILLGLHDSYPPLVAATFRALAEFSLLLGSSIVLTGLSASFSSTKNSEKTFFVEGGPRANILLDNVSPTDSNHSLTFQSTDNIKEADDGCSNFSHSDISNLQPSANDVFSNKRDEANDGIVFVSRKISPTCKLESDGMDASVNDETWLQFEVDVENVSQQEEGALLASNDEQKNYQNVCESLTVTPSLPTDFFVDMEPVIMKQTVPLAEYFSDGKLSISTKFSANEAEDENLYQGDWGD